MLQKPYFIVVNKRDIGDFDDSYFKDNNIPIFKISARYGDGLDKLVLGIREFFNKLN